MLFEVAIIETPVKKKDEDAGKERLVLKPIVVVAKDTQAAALEAVMDNMEALKDVDRSRMSVLVRPFSQ